MPTSKGGSSTPFEQDVDEQEEARHSRDDLAVSLSERIRKPLMPVRSSLFVLERAAPGSEQARRALAIIHRQVNELARIADELVELAPARHDSLVELDRGRVELGPLVESVAREREPALREAGISLEQELARDPLIVRGDAQRLQEMVRGMLEHAAQQTAAGGRLRIRLEHDGTNAVLRVEHTCAGLSPEALARAAERTADALALSELFAELHGGTFGVRRGPEGRGAELAVRLPLLIGPPGALLTELDATGPVRRVLIVEDNPDAASSLCEVLQLMGYDVAVAGDGPQAIALGRSFDPDIVLCDLGLPGMNGYEVARTFRADPVLRRAVLVALTGHALPEDQHRALEAGFAHHLAKPLSPEALERLLV